MNEPAFSEADVVAVEDVLSTCFRAIPEGTGSVGRVATWRAALLQAGIASFAVLPTMIALLAYPT